MQENLMLFAETQKPDGVSASVLILTAVVIAVPLLFAVVWLKFDYNRHKKPLVAIDSNVDYTFWHHIKVVTIPLLSYRITFMIQKKK